MATTTFDAVTKIGYPESRIILSQCATYLASSPKSNAAVVAIMEAQKAVAQFGDQPVPLHIRNAPTKMMKDMDYGKIINTHTSAKIISSIRNTCRLHW